MPAAAMTDHDALLAAVLEHPEDDAPRLVLADWFEENGQAERAEFVRVQCELARVMRHRPGHNGGTSTGMIDPMRAWRETVDALRRRERGLWVNGCVEWFAHLKDVPVCVALTEGDACDKPTHGIPVRGFIGELRTTLAGFMGGCNECGGSGCSRCGAVGVFAREPVSAVRIVDRKPYLEPGSGYRFFRGDDRTEVHLPPALYDLLDQPYQSRDAALAALSRAATNYGRVAAGLSPLSSAPSS